MPYTPDQIRQKAYELENAGAPTSDIEAFVSQATQEAGIRPVASTQEEQKPSNLLSLSFRGIQKGVDIAEKGIRFTGVPSLIGKTTQVAGGAVGGLIGGGLETGRQLGRAVTGKDFDVGQIGKTVKQIGRETAEFGKFVGEEGAVAAPFAGLGKIPSAIISVPIFTQGIKEKDPTKIAIGALGFVGAKYSKGKWIEPISGKSFPRFANEVKLADQATNTFRSILKPTQSEIKNIEIRQGKNIDDYYRLAAEEQLQISKSADNKLDTVAARDQLRPKQEKLQNILNETLSSDTTKKFDLFILGNRAKNELKDKIKNATEYKAAAKEIDEFIADEVERYGREVDGATLNNIKQGWWSVSYNQLRPTTQSNARKLGHIAKESIEEKYPDFAIKELNELSGKYATLSHLLEAAHGRTVASGVLGKLAARGAGLITGGAIPLGPLGPLAGQYIGSKVGDIVYDPLRRSLQAGKQAEKAGITGRSFEKITKLK